MKEKQHALRTPDSDARRRAPIVVQRKCGCGGSCTEVPRSVSGILGSAGHPLDADTRASMESRFGRSLADVRVHTDTHAAESAKEINAAAYTSGTHIVFGTGRFAPHTTSGRHLLAHELAHVMQQRSGTALPSGVGPADDIYERAADRVADLIVAQGPTFAPPPAIAPIAERLVRRKHEDEEPAGGEEEAHRLIVEDSAAPVPGQLRRKEFVELFDTAICATSREEMSRLGRSTEGCPLLEQWRPRIRSWSARRLEIAIRKWIGQDVQVRDAREYIPRVTAKLAESIRIWGATGSVAGIPPDLMDLLAGGTIKLSVGSMLRGAIGSLFRKARDGSTSARRLPAGWSAGGPPASRPLDATVASRMGRAFGHDFTNVRIHTNTDADAAVTSVNARAFTIGSDIAFANGEYAPGTLIGDALLAHELAHVVQQDGAVAMAKSDDATSAIEHDADDAAVHAVASMWPNVRRFVRETRTSAMPRLKSSLQLQRCPEKKEFTPNPKDIGGFTKTFQCTANEESEIRALHPEAIARVDATIKVLSEPNKLPKYDSRLAKHFGTNSTSGAIDGIRANYEKILAQMRADSIQFACADYDDPICQSRPDAKGPTIAVTDVCSGIVTKDPKQQGVMRITLCGNRIRKGRFLWTNRNWLQMPWPPRERTDWVKTIIHEYAHTLCQTVDRSGYKENAPVMHPTGIEHYLGEPDYPTKAPTLNPDSYASFAMEATKPK